MSQCSNPVARSKAIEIFLDSVLSPRQQFEMRLPMYVAGPDDLTRHDMNEWREHRYKGVYLLFDDAGQLLYVGRAFDIGIRIYQHGWRAEIPAQSFGAIAVEDDSMDYYIKALENFYIKALSPPHNSRLEYFTNHETREFDRLQRLWASASERTTSAKEPA